MASSSSGGTSPSDELVTWNSHTYPARSIAAGAAYELFSDTAGNGFEPNPGPLYTYHRFVHARRLGDARVLHAPDPPLTVPLSDGIDESAVQRLTQSRGIAAPVVRVVHDSARIRPGTKMVKPLSPRQAARVLHSPPWVAGVCYREHDTAHLRTPEQRRLLEGDPHDNFETSLALRWRACASIDYSPLSIEYYPGLVSLPASDFRGAPVLGSGFLPSERHLIPEFVTADMADVPLSDRAELLAYTAEGTEVVYFQYLAERGAWTRMAGPRWRELRDVLPGVDAQQEAFPVPETRQVELLGSYQGRRHPVVPDPPREFRVRAKSAAARFTVHDPARVYRTASWREESWVVSEIDNEWVRLRLRQPTATAVRATNAECTERGMYECWAPAREIPEIVRRQRDYPLPS